MKFLILAAGIGKRMMPLTKSKPKCFLEINKKPIIEYILDTIDPKNRFDKFIVVGREGNCWNNKIYQRLKLYRLKVIYNSKNIQLDNTYSLLLGLKKIGKEPIIIIDGDIIFKREIFMKLLNSKYENTLLSRIIESSSEKGGRIKVDVNDKVVKISESVSGKRLYIYSGIIKIGERLNVYLQKNLIKHEKIVDALDEACKSFNIYNLSFDGKQGWININNIRKLEEARKIYEKKS